MHNNESFDFNRGRHSSGQTAKEEVGQLLLHRRHRGVGPPRQAGQSLETWAQLAPKGGHHPEHSSPCSSCQPQHQGRWRNPYQLRRQVLWESSESPLVGSIMSRVLWSVAVRVFNQMVPALLSPKLILSWFELLAYVQLLLVEYWCLPALPFLVF